jgi:hypothetical protein
VRTSKTKHGLQDYVLLGLPENPSIFGVERKTEGNEKFLLCDPTGEIHGPVYEHIMYIISPFYNPYTGEEEPSCNCSTWRRNRKLCIHLKKFYEKNPSYQSQEPLIQEELILNLRRELIKICIKEKLETYLATYAEISIKAQYKTNPQFREMWLPIHINHHKRNKAKKTTTEKFRLFLLDTLLNLNNEKPPFL